MPAEQRGSVSILYPCLLAIPGMACLALAVGAGLFAAPGSVLRDRRSFFAISAVSWLVLTYLLHRKAAIK